MSETIGKKLKQLRKSRGMTQEDVAERVSITRSTISNYEVGRRTPNLKELSRLAAVFGVGLDFFGVSEKDETFDLLARAREIFQSPAVDEREKEKLYFELMKIYVEMRKD